MVLPYGLRLKKGLSTASSVYQGLMGALFGECISVSGNLV